MTSEQEMSSHFVAMNVIVLSTSENPPSKLEQVRGSRFVARLDTYPLRND